MSDLDTTEPKHRGVDILRDPRLNKMTCFSEEEREALGLVGLVPEGIDTETTQVQRVLHQINRKPTDLDKYIYLTALLDNDETLFFRVLMSDPARFMPLVYTPTVGDACQQYGHILRRPRGLYLSITRRGRFQRSFATGRNGTCVSSSLPTASASWAWATLARTEWVSPLASWHSTPPAPACRRKLPCPPTPLS